MTSITKPRISRVRSSSKFSRACKYRIPNWFAIDNYFDLKKNYMVKKKSYLKDLC